MFTTPRLVAIALCAALNFAIGNIVYLVKLPIYLDSIGTILCALLIFPDRRAAFVCASIAGFIGVILSGLAINPFLPWFTFTMLAIALVSALLTAQAIETFRAPGDFDSPANRIRVKATQLAKTLSAQLVGDDGEVYD